MNPLDEAWIRDLAEGARRNGRDVIEVLSQAGLLVTPKRAQQLKVIALQDLARDLGKWRPAEFLRRVNKVNAPTPSDMYNAILGYVDDYVRVEVERES